MNFCPGSKNSIIAKTARYDRIINEVTLSGQAFVKDPDTTVGALVKSKGATIKSFVRFEVGDGRV
jgi:elongation factor Ts